MTMSQKKYRWNEDKDRLLLETRWVCFAMIADAVDSWNLLWIEPNKNKDKYPFQEVMFVLLNDYVYEVPYISDWETAFLKTIIPSRKATKRFVNTVH
jgi:hypothetical protein